MAWPALELTSLLFKEVKLPEREAHHSRSLPAEINNEWSYTSTPHVLS
jgi:hypothetical protein